MRTVKILKDVDSVTEFTAQAIVQAAKEAVAERDQFTMALSGGSTPRPVYVALATTYQDEMPWDKTHLFWGDERTVAPDHPDSNYRMVQGAMLDRLGDIQIGGVHRIMGEAEPDVAAQEYEATMRQLFGAVAFPQFDVMLQGMGDDGHTASLFPFTLGLNEYEKWVIANEVPQQYTTRITMTYPVINHARKVIFMVTGEKKVDALYEVLHGEPNPAQYPSKAIEPEDGELIWVVDYAAGKRIMKET